MLNFNIYVEFCQSREWKIIEAAFVLRSKVPCLLELFAILYALSYLMQYSHFRITQK